MKELFGLFPVDWGLGASCFWELLASFLSAVG